jgi:hypothetical protein
MKVALLIPTTSKGRVWKSAKDSYLHNHSIKTFLQTMSPEYTYVFYIGYDNDDPLFSKESSRDILTAAVNHAKNVSLQFVEFADIPKGYLTKMWNVLYKKAHDEDCDYFYQCGDDIVFTTKHWVKDSIAALRKNDNIGIAGPLNNNARILTQVMVSRRHMDVFGFFFPEELINWCCDDWYNYLYYDKHFFPLQKHLCNNVGGSPRYAINNNPNFNAGHLAELRATAQRLAARHALLLEYYLEPLRK